MSQTLNMSTKAFILATLLMTGMLHAQDPPDWIEGMQEDDDYYWAKASSETRNLSEREYKERANEDAFITY